MSDFKGTVRVQNEIYYNAKSIWGIYRCSIVAVKQISENFKLEPEDVMIKGMMPQLKIGSDYLLTADIKSDKKYGEQLEVVSIANVVDQYPKTSYDKRRVLNQLFTSKQVDAMYETYSEPYDLFMNGELEKLVKIKGCGTKTAVAWADRFNNFIPLNKIYLELEEYQLTTNMAKKLLKQYRSADIAIEKVKADPYCLCEIDGVGWRTADKIALHSGIGEFSLPRLRSFVVSYLEQRGASGNSYIEPSELMAAILENIGEAVPDLVVTEAIHSLDRRLFWNETKTLIGLRKYWNLENRIADEVMRLLKASSEIQNDRFEEIRQNLENQQGWEFTDEQIEGAKLALKESLVIINGGAGTGKSSLIRLVLALLGKDIRYAQTALSGRAAARLAEVTKTEGYTIHRLLGYLLGPKDKGMFAYHDENQLDYDVIIIDEISMIGGKLFLSLLQAIRNGSKVIMLGDTGQLEAIGECNVAHDLLACESIPKITLTKCHRQAMKSAIITESMKVRLGQPIINNSWSGTETRGELEDFTLDCYSDSSNTYHKTIQHFTKILKIEKDIMNIQVLSPVKTRGNASIFQLNLALQAIYNPKKTDEIVVRNLEGLVYGIKVGDKVINTQNSYGVHLANDEDGVTDIFNGSLGIVKEVNPKTQTMVIDFQDAGVVLIDKETRNNIELAYAVSVHKFQGSECKYVIFALDFSSYSLLTRELVYTAITRAKVHFIMVAQNKALSYAVSHPSTVCKQTYLTDILNARLAPNLKFDF